jgi:hypothetical protein
MNSGIMKFFFIFIENWKLWQYYNPLGMPFLIVEYTSAILIPLKFFRLAGCMYRG